MEPGDYVIDTDDDEPNLAVVLHHSETPIGEWVIEPEGGQRRAVAADNPDYDEDEPVVVVAFVESGLERHWPDWTGTEPADLYEGTQEAGVKLYHFPESRLRVLEEAEVTAVTEEGAVAMSDLQARLEDADWQTDLDDGVLTVGKMGEQYHIHPTGEVEGEGQVRGPLENIVAEYRN
ncbi:MAG: hypothetical protein BRD23_04295 [Halobacteriales archaeon SW_9_67_25]|jgi:predicted transcriptional regulator|nr:MAG: hypothetical protein BRD23_04295 [Halobacteriales archaeon SW_9_67_25]